MENNYELQQYIKKYNYRKHQVVNRNRIIGVLSVVIMAMTLFIVFN